MLERYYEHKGDHHIDETGIISRCDERQDEYEDKDLMEQYDSGAKIIGPEKGTEYIFNSVFNCATPCHLYWDNYIN